MKCKRIKRALFSSGIENIFWDLKICCAIKGKKRYVSQYPIGIISLIIVPLFQDVVVPLNNVQASLELWEAPQVPINLSISLEQTLPLDFVTLDILSIPFVLSLILRLVLAAVHVVCLEEAGARFDFPRV